MFSDAELKAALDCIGEAAEKASSDPKIAVAAVVVAGALIDSVRRLASAHERIADAVYQIEMNTRDNGPG